ncbi:hypothetical protein [Acidicapsa ligni]|uniref:hypothetical protein n=1 Tax=Acidicapsa ligni TaxID=542300 RepID=UPI0021E0A66A|nr:hypothetical protein [Acidicapsa ligni]
MTEEFLKPKLIGERFSGHAVPLELLKDFAALQEMLVEVAKWKYLQEHPNRERVQRNFAKDIELQLAGVEEGSAILAIVLSFPLLVPPENAKYFQQAKAEIVESIAQSAEGHIPQLPPDYLIYFDRFGRGLRSGESIEFPRQQGAVTFNTDVRKQLIRAAKVETWTEEAALRAKIYEVNLAQDSFEFELSDGSRAKAPMDDKYRDTVLEALKAYHSEAFFLIQGVVQRDHLDKVKGFESIEHVTALDPLDTTLRLEQIAQLKDGWLDGKGVAPTKGKLNWLGAAFDAGFSPDLPLPYLYPTVEGGIQAEWSLHDWSVTLEINLETQIGEYQTLNLKDQTSTDLQFHFGEPGGWEQLNQALKQIDAQTVEAS